MKLNYKRLGEGQPIIILHGLFGTLDNWYGIGKYFSANHDVILVDQRNHGLSGHSDDWNYQLMSEDLSELIADLNLFEPIIIGHSMGGKTAMEFATTNSSDVKGLVIVDIAPKHYPPHHGTIIEGLKSLNLSEINSRSDANIALARTISEEGTRQFLLKNLKRNTDGSYSWKMNLKVIEKNIDNVGEALKGNRKYSGPTKFIRGGNSDYINDSDSNLILNHFPNMELVTIEKAGHWVHAEQPQKFGEELEKFFKNVS